jgi:hypothetical protein
MRVFKNYHIDLLSSSRLGGHAHNAMRVLAVQSGESDVLDHPMRDRLLDG